MNPASVGRFIDRVEGAFLEHDARSASKEVEAANVRRLQEQYRAILRGDFEFVSDSMADDIDMEMIGPPNLPLVGHWRGRQEVAEAVRNNFAQLERGWGVFEGDGGMPQERSHLLFAFDNICSLA